MTEEPRPTGRVVVVVRDDLPAWRVANAAAVLGVTLGARLPDVDGPDIETADDQSLGPISRHAVPVLVADAAAIDALHAAAREHADVEAAALDDAMLTTNSYDEYAADVRARPFSEFACFALAVAGSKSAMRRLTRGLALYGA